MAVGFGFSISDIWNAFKIIKESVNALDKEKGASADFDALVLEVQSAQDGLEAVDDLLQSPNLQPRQKAALGRSIESCHVTIRNFLSSIAKYQPLLRNERLGLSGNFGKIKWALCKKDDVARFRAQLARQTSALNMLVVTLQSKQQVTPGYKQEKDGAVARLEQDQTDIFSEMLSSMSLEHRQHFMMIMQQNNQLMESVQEMKQLLHIQRAVAPQVLLQQPVILLDPFGRLAPFHLDFIDTPECFISVLRTRFAQAGIKPPGLLKLDHREFNIEDTKTQKPVNLDQKWDRLWEPGGHYDMRMVFHRFTCPPSTCPSCHSDNDNDVQVRCRVCGLEYQNLQTTNLHSHDWHQQLPPGADIQVSGKEIPYILQHPKRRPELKVFRPCKESEDEIFAAYRRVQIISQSPALLDIRFPALTLIEDFARFAKLVQHMPSGLSPYQTDIAQLGVSAMNYVDEKQRIHTAFASYSQIKQANKHLTRTSFQLRQEIDQLVQILCEDSSTKDLLKHLEQSKTTFSFFIQWIWFPDPA